jgi:NAD(P)-dependent dehydrogenase (short-subunit alcohol dehydrogenase family)
MLVEEGDNEAPDVGEMTQASGNALHPPSFGLTGQVAVVTGGGAGIGQGIALGLAGCGVDVVVADVDPDRAEVTARRVTEAGGRSAVVATDVTDTDQVRAMVDAAVERFGRLDILVNNAGGVGRRPFLDQSERSWRRHIDLNLTSVLAGISAAAPVMIEQGRGGSILNVVSIEAVRAAPNYAVYAACKAAVVSFTRTMALELAEHGIRVNALAPDHVDTPGIRGMVRGPVPDPLPPRPPEAEAASRAYIPLGRPGVPEDCAGAAVFLCSDLGRYVTGVNLHVDGGTWASSGWTRGAEPGDWRLSPG